MIKTTLFDSPNSVITPPSEYPAKYDLRIKEWLR
jgi:hypothetical protein